MIIPSGIAKRYGTALFRAALKTGKAGDVNEEVAGFRKVFSEDETFRGFLLSPQVLTKDKTTLIEKAFRDRATPLFVNFLLMLIEKQRFPFVEEIGAAYTALFEEHEGILEVRVITAIELDESTQTQVLEKLEKETAKKIRLNPEIDPRIIGGIIFILGDKIIDASVKYQLEKLRRTLDEVRVA